jgi:hypothetical protein
MSTYFDMLKKSYDLSKIDELEILSYVYELFWY